MDENKEFIISIKKDKLEEKVKRLFELNFESVSEKMIETEDEYFVLVKYTGKEDYKKAYDKLVENGFNVDYNDEYRISQS